MLRHRLDCRRQDRCSGAQFHGINRDDDTALSQDQLDIGQAEAEYVAQPDGLAGAIPVAPNPTTTSASTSQRAGIDCMKIVVEKAMLQLRQMIPDPDVLRLWGACSQRPKAPHTIRFSPLPDTEH
jgi:hypothetical protein